MGLTHSQKKYLKKNLKNLSLREICAGLGVSEKETLQFLKLHWRREKYEKFLKEQKKRENTQENHFGIVLNNFSFAFWFKHNWKILVFLAFIVLTVYFNSLGGSFISDDISGILQNPQIKNFSHVFDSPAGTFRRFILILIANSFGLEPLAFHFSNILFHLGSTIVLYFLITRLFNPKIGFIASSLFAVHPINTESVSWISGGVHAQYSFFILLSFFFYYLFLDNQLKKYYFFSLGLFSSSLFLTEKGIIFPILLSFFTYSQYKITKAWKHLLPFFILSFCFAFFYFYSGIISQRVASLQTTFYQEGNLYNSFIQIPVAITSYLELIFWPKNLTFYHSEMSFSQVEYFFRLGVFLFFLGVIVWFFKKDRRIFFWLSFFLISLLPTLTPLGISWIVAERYVYLGTIGIIVPFAVLIEYIGRKTSEPKIAYIILTILLFILGARTFLRNNDWKNQDTLWLATAKVSPSSAQNHNNLGDYYARRENLEKAAEEFQIAIQLLPGYADAYHNLANTYHQMGKIDLAIENYQKALQFKPSLWQSSQNLTIIYFEQKKFDLAKETLQQALKLNPQVAILHTNLAVVYLNAGEPTEAVKELETALKLDPSNQTTLQILNSIKDK